MLLLIIFSLATTEDDSPLPPPPVLGYPVFLLGKEFCLFNVGSCI